MNIPQLPFYRYLCAGLTLLSFSETVLAKPKFTDVSSSAGINYIQYGGTGLNPQDQQPVMSGGAAAGDYDGDGWIDLYVTRQDAPGILYRNRGNGTFQDVTLTAFGANHMKSPVVAGNGATWGDIDNDGDLDLYVTTLAYGSHFLFVNNGSGKFTEEADARGAGVIDVNQTPSYGFSATFGDYDGDGYLDLHVTEWRLTNQINGDPFVTQFNQHNTRLLRNRGAANPGRFVDVTDAAGVAVEQVPSNAGELTNGEAFASRFSDIDRDGHPDLLIASDHRTSRLFWNDGDGTFTDGTEAAGVGTDHNGMGSALGDYDGDGDLDWFVTSIYEEGYDPESHLARDGNRLYRYDGNRKFTDTTDTAGVRNGAWGWGTAFIDYDNDGDLDLAMTNGMDYPSGIFDNGFQDDKSVFWENDGSGKFTNISDTVTFNDRLSGKGLLMFDYDHDGDLDIFIVNNSARPLLYRNDGGNAAKWLRMDLSGTRSNTHALGAFVTVTPDLTKPNKIMVREVNGGSHYLGQSETTLHFGLGTATKVDEVMIEWPDGATTFYNDLDTNQLYAIEQPSSIILNRQVEDQELALGEPFSLQLETSLVASGFAFKNAPAGISISSTGLISGTPTEWGHFSVSLTIQHQAGNKLETLDFTVFTNYETWASGIFTETGEGSTSVSGPDVDFDSDGRSNFQEYVDQTNPKTYDQAVAAFSSVMELGSAVYPTVEYREFGYANDLETTVQASSALIDLSESSDSTIEVSRIEGEDGIETVVARGNASLESSAQIFFQVKTAKSE